MLKGLALFRKQAHGEALPLLLQAYRFVSLPPRDRKSDIFFEDSIDMIDLVEVIGICFAETGRFDKAVETAQRARKAALEKRLAGQQPRVDKEALALWQTDPSQARASLTDYCAQAADEACQMAGRQ